MITQARVWIAWYMVKAAMAILPDGPLLSALIRVLAAGTAENGDV